MISTSSLTFPPLDYPVKHTAHDGIAYPVFCPEDLVKSRTLFIPRDDDVIVTSYPRSGTTWTLQIVRNIHLVQRPGLFPEHGLRSAVAQISTPWINRDKGSRVSLDKMESPRVMKSHNHYIHLNVPRTNKDFKIIHVLRDPRDVACSLYHHYLQYASVFQYTGTFPEFVEEFLRGRTAYGDYWDYNSAYVRNTEGYNILYVTYEQLSEDKKSCIARISRFLGYQSISSQQIAEVDKRTRFDKMTKEHKHLRGRGVKGEIGRYKEMLDDKQIKKFVTQTRTKFYGLKAVPERYMEI